MIEHHVRPFDGIDERASIDLLMSFDVVASI